MAKNDPAAAETEVRDEPPENAAQPTAEEEREADERVAAQQQPTTRLAQEQEAELPENERIPVAHLRANSRRLTGYPSRTVAGALHGVTDEEMTVQQLTERVETWLNEEIKG